MAVITEAKSGIAIAVFSAVLALVNMLGTKYGEDEMIAHDEKTLMYSWYQSKSIKQSLASGEKDMLESFLRAGVIDSSKRESVAQIIEDKDVRVQRYDKEKKEILLGSSVVGEENWAQDKNGRYGEIIGAEQWQVRATAFEVVGVRFDYATLFLQLALVLGGVSLVSRENRMKAAFFSVMLISGIIGTFMGIYAFQTALTL